MENAHVKYSGREMVQQKMRLINNVKYVEKIWMTTCAERTPVAQLVPEGGGFGIAFPKTLCFGIF